MSVLTRHLSHLYSSNKFTTDDLWPLEPLLFMSAPICSWITEDFGVFHQFEVADMVAHSSNASSQAAVTTLLGLDDSLAQECLSLLPAANLLCAGATCRALRKLSKGENTVWRKLCARRGLPCAVDPNFGTPPGELPWSTLYRRIQRVAPVNWSSALVGSWAKLDQTLSAIEDHPMVAMSLEEGFQVVTHLQTAF